MSIKNSILKMREMSLFEGKDSTINVSFHVLGTLYLGTIDFMKGEVTMFLRLINSKQEWNVKIEGAENVIFALENQQLT